MKKVVANKFCKMSICAVAIIVCVFGIAGCSKQSNETYTFHSAQPQQLHKAKTTKPEIPQNIDIDLSDRFNDINGCAVIFSPQDNQYFFYNRDICTQRASPYSTFKVVSTLIGLHNGIIANETSVMNYNGTQYPVDDWNHNLSLKDAFQSSCIWYFRQIIDIAGQDEVQKELANLLYGNCDISEWNGNNTNSIKELNGFWLNSSLKISALEQVQVLSQIFEGQNMYDTVHINILQNIMLVDASETKKIYGKTGSGSDGEAWFIGFSEENNQRIYFAIYLNDTGQSQDISGTTAKEIALEIMR